MRCSQNHDDYCFTFSLQRCLCQVQDPAKVQACATRYFVYKQIFVPFMLVFNFEITMFIRKSSITQLCQICKCRRVGEKTGQKITEYTVESSLFVRYQLSMAFWGNPCKQIYNHLFNIDPNYPDYVINKITLPQTRKILAIYP